MKRLDAISQVGSCPRSKLYDLDLGKHSVENSSVFRPLAGVYGISDENQTDFTFSNASYALGLNHPIGPPRRLGRDDDYPFWRPPGIVEHFLFGLVCLHLD